MKGVAAAGAFIAAAIVYAAAGAHENQFTTGLMVVGILATVFA